MKAFLPPPPCRSRSRAGGRSRRSADNRRVETRGYLESWGFWAISYFCPTNDVKRAMVRIHTRLIVLAALLAGALTAWQMHRAAAQVATDNAMQISWEVRNRFRLFREERDFLLHVDSSRGRNIIASEQALALQSDGRGWARNMVNRLCIDLVGRVSEPCSRDNVKESYLTPT